MNSKTNIKKNLREIEKKLEEVKETMQEQARGIDRDNSFSYWLGFRRALEWILNEQTTKARNKK